MANTVEVVFVLDRSGSMNGKEEDIIGGFNSMIRKQREEGGSAYVSTVLFSDESSVLHDRILIADVPEMTEKDYWTAGNTALLDATGDAIRHIRNVHKYARPEDRPDKTLFIVMTDGYENASRRYSNEQLKKLVEKQKERGWEFIFIGADIDSFAVARSVGIGSNRAVRLSKEKDSYETCFSAVGSAVRYSLATSRDDDKLDDDTFLKLFEAFETEKNKTGLLD